MKQSVGPYLYVLHDPITGRERSKTELSTDCEREGDENTGTMTSGTIEK